MADSSLFFYIDGKGFGYCVPGSDLLVGDMHLVYPGDEVKFKYGKSTYTGSVISISDKEKEILSAIKKKSKVKKEDSFNASKPRKAKVKGIDKLTTSGNGEKPQPIKRTLRAKEAKEVKSLRDKTALTNELKMSTDAEQVLSDDTSSTSSDSRSGSSVQSVPLQIRKGQNWKDLKKLNTAPSSDEEDNGKETQEKESVKDNSKEQETIEGEIKGKETSQEKTKETKDKGGKKKKMESESSETELLSDSESEPENKKAKVQKKSKCKRNMTDQEEKIKEKDKGGKKKKTASESSEPESVSDSESEPEKKKAKVEKKSKCKRNMTIFPGQNYRCSRNEPGAVQLCDEYDVYVKKKYLDQAKRAKTQSQYCRNLLDKVYTIEALKGSTLLGYPPRGRGAAMYSTSTLPPRLHPNGVDAIIQSCLKLEETNKKWRPRMTEATLTSRLAGRLWEVSHH